MRDFILRNDTKVTLGRPFRETTIKGLPNHSIGEDEVVRVSLEGPLSDTLKGLGGELDLIKIQEGLNIRADTIKVCTVDWTTSYAVLKKAIENQNQLLREKRRDAQKAYKRQEREIGKLYVEIDNLKAAKNDAERRLTSVQEERNMLKRENKFLWEIEEIEVAPF